MKVVVDVDAGLDDAQAIMMVLGCKDADLKCITTVDGNTTVDNVCRNVLRVLNRCNREDIPVHRGCESPILKLEDYTSVFHGKDGFGDFPHTDNIDMTRIQKEHAVNKLISLSKEFEGELTLLTLGPLTNVAMALRLDPNFSSRLKDCFIMGGNYHGVGNTTPTSEFNFHHDPEAAKIVLAEMKCPVTLICWEFCLKHETTWDWRTTELLGKDSKSVNLLRDSEQSLLGRYYSEPREYVFADQLAAGVLLYPELVTGYQNLHCDVVVDGQARGMMAVNRKNKAYGPKAWPAHKVITDIELKSFLNKMKASIHSLP